MVGARAKILVYILIKLSTGNLGFLSSKRRFVADCYRYFMFLSSDSKMVLFFLKQAFLFMIHA